MRSGGGGIKGGAFERLICKELSKAVSGGKRKDLYWRSSMSGGRSTVMHKAGDSSNIAQAGDISTVDPMGHFLTDQFVFECKHRAPKRVRMLQFFLYGTGPIREWLEDTYEICKRMPGKKPVVIVRQNGMPILVFTCATYIEGPPRVRDDTVCAHLVPQASFPDLALKNVHMYHFDDFLLALAHVCKRRSVVRERP